MVAQFFVECEYRFHTLRNHLWPETFSFPEYIVGSSNIAAVDDMLGEKDTTFQAIRWKLIKAQENMKKYADTKRRDITHQVGDWVLL